MPGEYCTECHNLGFVIMGNNDRNKGERCDTCRRFDNDEEATKALDQFIAKYGGGGIMSRPITLRDRIGRPYRVHVCKAGHWHRSHNHMARCHARLRKAGKLK